MTDQSLPKGWASAWDSNGRVYFIDHVNRKTTYTDPRSVNPLPQGWETAVDPKGRTYYIDHNRKTTTYEDPRVSKQGETKRRSHSRSQSTPNNDVVQQPATAIQPNKPPVAAPSQIAHPTAQAVHAPQQDAVDLPQPQAHAHVSHPQQTPNAQPHSPPVPHAAQQNHAPQASLHPGATQHSAPQTAQPNPPQQIPPPLTQQPQSPTIPLNRTNSSANTRNIIPVGGPVSSRLPPGATPQISTGGSSSKISPRPMTDLKPANHESKSRSYNAVEGKAFLAQAKELALTEITPSDDSQKPRSRGSSFEDKPKAPLEKSASVGNVLVHKDETPNEATKEPKKGSGIGIHALISPRDNVIKASSLPSLPESLSKENNHKPLPTVPISIPVPAKESQSQPPKSPNFNNPMVSPNTLKNAKIPSPIVPSSPQPVRNTENGIPPSLVQDNSEVSERVSDEEAPASAPEKATDTKPASNRMSMAPAQPPPATGRSKVETSNTLRNVPNLSNTKAALFSKGNIALGMGPPPKLAPHPQSHQPEAPQQHTPPPNNHPSAVPHTQPPLHPQPHPHPHPHPQLNIPPPLQTPPPMINHPQPQTPPPHSQPQPISKSSPGVMLSPSQSQPNPGSYDKSNAKAKQLLGTTPPSYSNATDQRNQIKRPVSPDPSNEKALRKAASDLQELKPDAGTTVDGQKRSGAVLQKKKHHWFNRWLILGENSVALYNSEPLIPTKPKKIIQLASDCTITSLKSEQKFLLILKTPKKEYKFQLPTETEMLEWEKDFATIVPKEVVKETKKEKEKGKSQHKRRESLGGTSKNIVFGADIQYVVDRQKEAGSMLEIPQIVDAACSFLSSYENLNAEGIFRLSGSTVTVQELKSQTDLSGKLEIPPGCDPHAITGLLKLYLRELPDSLIPAAYFNSFMSAHRDMSQVGENLTSLISSFPLSNRLTIRLLFDLVGHVVQYQNSNRMTAQNLAIVIGPNILRSNESNPMAVMESTQAINELMCILIEGWSRFRDQIYWG